MDKIFTQRIERFRGLYTDKSARKIPDGFSPQNLNCDFRTDGRVGADNGYLRHANNDTTVGSIVSIHPYKKGDNSVVQLRVRDDGSNDIWEWLSPNTTSASLDGKYEILKAGLTRGKYTGFAPYNGTGTDNLFICNSVEALTRWSGANTYITATVTGSPASIAVSDTTDFPASGTIIYNGTEVAYTSKTATTFVKSSGSFHDSSGSDDGIAEAVDTSTYSSDPKGNLMAVAEGRLWLSGVTDAPNRLYYSDTGVDPSAWGGNGFTGDTPADGGLEDFPEGNGAIRAISYKDGKVIIHKEDMIGTFSLDYPTSTTKVPIRKVLVVGESVGAISQKAVVSADNFIYYINGDGRLKRIASSSDTELGFLVTSVFDIIEPSLDGVDLTDACLGWYPQRRLLMFGLRSDSNQSVNQLAYKVFFKPNGQYDITPCDWNISDFYALDGKFYFGSSVDSNIYEAFTGYSKNGAPITTQYTIKQLDFGRPFNEKEMNIVAVRGFIGSGTTITMKVLYDDDGKRGIIEREIDWEDEGVGDTIINTLGTRALGTQTIGGAISGVGELLPFTVFIELPNSYVFYDIQLAFETTSAGARWYLESIGFDPAVSGEINSKIRI